MSISQQTVVTCDHAECPQSVSRQTPSDSLTDAAWLDNSGWVQFKAKKASGNDGLAFCPQHFADLRQFFGPMDAADGLVLTQGKAV